MDWKPFLYGGLASVSAELGTFPIDTTKTRLQLQGQVMDKALSQVRYRGMIHAVLRISREEGPLALYSGIAPAVLRQATYGTFKIGLYHGIKRLICENPKDETLYYNIVAGMLAGSIAAAICNPTDVLKIRMQAKTKGTIDTSASMLRSFVDISKMEGIRGLYRGVGPTAQRAAIVAGVELPVYDWCKRLIVTSGFMDDNVYAHFSASTAAGLAGAIASNPIDVAKTRMMNQRNMKDGSASASLTIYKSSFDCMKKTVVSEGFLALYKGFIPNFARLCPWNIFFFMSYEQYKLLGQKYLP